MKLPSLKISTKVRNAAVASAIVTIIVGFVSESPLRSNQWLKFLQNPTYATAIVSLVGAVAGYGTEERSFGDDRGVQPEGLDGDRY